MCRSSHQGVEVRAEVRGKTQRTGKFMLMNASRVTELVLYVYVLYIQSRHTRVVIKTRVTVLCA